MNESDEKLRQLIAENIAYYRKLNGDTQAGLAEKLSYSDKSVSKWERGDGTPDIFILSHIASLYGITVQDLLREKKVFIAESPLYEIVCKDKSYFAYDEAEKAQILRQLEGQKYKVSRSKGLGENEPEMMRQTTMNPATRRLISVTPADEAETDRIFETLLGDDIAARKAFITEYGPQYMSEIDRSGDDA